MSSVDKAAARAASGYVAAAARVDMVIERHPTLNATNYRGRTEIKGGELLHEPSRLFVFVGFSDDRRLMPAC